MSPPPHAVLHDEAAIAARVHGLAAAIRRDLPGDSLLVVGVLTGSFVFTADLARELVRQGIEPRIELVWASLYDADGRPGERVRLLRDLEADPAGRAVLLVDDILDTGRTLALLRDRIAARGPAWLRTCVLLDKPGPRLAPVEADYAGFEAPDAWVFGYGMDTEGEGRALPYLAVQRHHAD